MRIGCGFDAHRLVDGRALIVGGVNIPYPKGLLGHSDADVLVHAVIDAILGAAALPDIGTLFPDTDDAYKGISSIELLKKVRWMLPLNELEIENIDSTIIAQAPMMNKYIPLMRRNIADALGISSANVNVKATSEEGMGYTGRGEGISAQAVALLK